MFPEARHPYPEQVFLHELPPGPVEVGVQGRRGLGLGIRFDADALPGLVQWRVAEPRCTVLGIEPATAATILGRADARARGLLRSLGPGDSWQLGVEFEVRGRLD